MIDLHLDSIAAQALQSCTTSSRQAEECNKYDPVLTSLPCATGRVSGRRLDRPCVVKLDLIFAQGLHTLHMNTRPTRVRNKCLGTCVRKNIRAIIRKILNYRNETALNQASGSLEYHRSQAVVPCLARSCYPTRNCARR